MAHGPDGFPIPEQQGIVTGEIKPIVFKDPKQGDAFAIGAALDEHGNVVIQAITVKDPDRWLDEVTDAIKSKKP
jgi:hypothetical protein